MKKFFKDWGKFLLLGLGILVFAFILRFKNLTTLPIFADEAIYIRWSQVMRAEPTLRFLPLSDGKQPLFMWVTIPFLKLISDPLVAGRLTSVFAGMGTLIGIFFLTYFLFKSKKAATLSALFYALTPFGIFFDRMALADSLLSMFGVWTLLGGVLTVKTKRLDYAMLTGFCLGGALLTKSPALFFALLLPGTLILANWKGSWRAKLLQLLKFIFLFSFTYAIGYGLLNILRLGPNFGMISSRNQDYIYPLSHILTNPKDPFIFYFDRAFEWMWALGPWVVLILAAFGFLLNLKKFGKEILLVLAWFIVPILIQSEFAKVFTARYILFSIPYLLILAGASFLANKALWKKILTLGLIVFIFHAASIDYKLLTSPEGANLPRSERSGYLEEWTAGTGIKEVSEFLKEEQLREPEEKIVVGTEGFFGTLPDGLQIYLNDIPQITVIGVGVSISDLHQSLIDSKKAGNKTYLVVNSTRFSGNPDTQGLELIAAYPKAVRPDGVRETLLFYELTEKSIPSKVK